MWTKCERKWKCGKYLSASLSKPILNKNLRPGRTKSTRSRLSGSKRLRRKSGVRRRNEKWLTSLGRGCRPRSLRIYSIDLVTSRRGLSSSKQSKSSKLPLSV